MIALCVLCLVERQTDHGLRSCPAVPCLWLTLPDTKSGLVAKAVADPMPEFAIDITALRAAPCCRATSCFRAGV